MTKILCILDMRPNRHYSLERLPSIVRALDGWDATYFDIYKFEFRFGERKNPETVNWDFVAYVLKNNISIVFSACEWLDFVSAETIIHLQNKNVLISGVLGDDENNYAININYLGLFTVPVGYARDEVEGYKKTNPNTYRIPISVSLFETENFLTIKKETDLIFIGRVYGDRPEILRYLSDSGIRLSVFGGDSWKKYFDSNVYKGYVGNDQYYQEISKSKIVLALFGSPKGDLLHVNAKPFDAAKTGTALVVTRYKNFLDEYDLQEGEELLAFSSKEELLSAVQSLLHQEEKRQKLAWSFRKKIGDSFEYDKLYREFFERLTEVKDSQPPIKRARVLFLNPGERPSVNDANTFDYVVICKENVRYSSALENVLAAHIATGNFVKLDSMYSGRVARKVFDFIDLASLAIPIDRFSEVRSFAGIARVKGASQTYIPLNSYTKASLYLAILIALRIVHKNLK